VLKKAKTTLQPDPVKYVDWVQRVLQAAGELTRADAQARLIGVAQEQVLGRLGGPSDPPCRPSMSRLSSPPSAMPWWTWTGWGWSSLEAYGRGWCA